MRCWSAAATCNIPASLLPAGSNLFRLKTRCLGDNPTCEKSASTLIDVIQNVTPPAIQNVLRATQAGNDVNLSWASILGSPISAYRIYQHAVKCGVATPAGACSPPDVRQLIDEVPASATTAIDSGGITEPPTTAFYQILGVSCLGDIEGPY